MHTKEDPGLAQNSVMYYVASHVPFHIKKGVSWFVTQKIR